MSADRLAIVVSGGPAPGINSAVSSCVIEARNRGMTVFGADHGFRGLCTNGADALRELSIGEVSLIHATGGSVLGVSRYNPLRDAQSRAAFTEALRAKAVTKLVVIGGEGSAYLSDRINEELPELSVVHLPKTIDNDLVLPNNFPSFGFETARSVGTEILGTLIEDARTTRRWFVVSTMGRRAGFLALGLGLASGATLTLIPEEFEDRMYSLDEMAGIIFGSIRHRYSEGKPYGLALVAEGLVDRIDPHSSEHLRELPRDELGRVRYSTIELADLLAGALRRRCASESLPVKFVTKNIGYELRCHTPLSFDIEYTRFLGYGAVKFLCAGARGVMVARDFDRLLAEPLAAHRTADGGIQSRSVDLSSELYAVARSFMIRPPGERTPAAGE